LSRMRTHLNFQGGPGVQRNRLNFRPTDAEGTVRGRLTDSSQRVRSGNQQFEGKGFLKVIPAKAQF
jgi:hypothetical protein